jgi:hypothetical protein
LGEASVLGRRFCLLSKFLVTAEVSVVRGKRMREEDKKERLERQYLLFTQPFVCYLTSALFPESDSVVALRSSIIYEIK